MPSGTKLLSPSEPPSPSLCRPRVSLTHSIYFDSLHVGAFFARVLACVGGTSITSLDSAFASLDKNLVNGTTVGPKLKAYIVALFERESFKDVYADGLH